MKDTIVYLYSYYDGDLIFKTEDYDRTFKLSDIGNVLLYADNEGYEIDTLEEYGTVEEITVK